MFNVLMFSCGFLTLTLSDFTPLRHLGLLVALALSISGGMSLLLISLLALLLLEPGAPGAQPQIGNAAQQGG